MEKLSPDARKALAQAAAKAAAKAVATRRAMDPLVLRFGERAVSALYHNALGAKQRCTNPNSAAFANYGGRGIEFKFSSPKAFAEWALLNIGPKPTPGHSLDRVDNNRHYEPGNLRWATRVEQARNKRAYKRTLAGDRIRVLQAHRPDLTYETLRSWIKQGATDDEILQRRKYARACV